MRHHVVQRAAVLMHYDEGFAARVYVRAPVRGLDDDELALLRKTDARAFRTDPERPLRLMAALLEEYPVSCAVAGAQLAATFTTTSVFHNAILSGRLLADSFGDWLFARVGDVAMIELAVALARRRRRRRGTPGSLARAPGVEVARVAAGTLDFYARARAQLGPAAHEAVARGARIDGPGHTDAGGALEHLLATPGVAAVASQLRGPGREGTASPMPSAPNVATCAEPLFALLSFARQGRAPDAVVEEARGLGAGDDAAELVDDLVRDGLLAVV